MENSGLLRELDRRPLLCDGAMGTQLMARGLPGGACGENWNLEQPDRVEAIHRSYRDAGCDLITTNTFGGTLLALRRHGQEQQVEAVNKAGAQVALRAAGPQGRVLGDIGPTGDFLEPLGDITEGEMLDMFRQQAAALQAGGAHAVLVETMADPQEMALAIRAARELGDWPILATYAFQAGGDTYRTMMGTPVQAALAAALDAGADIVGANCGASLGLDDYLCLAEQLVQYADDAPVILQPNAGSPQTINGDTVYPATPDMMAQMVPRLLQTGVRIIGGCCGTSPDHLRAMHQAMVR